MLLHEILGPLKKYDGDNKKELKEGSKKANREDWGSQK